jgi:hypothetical protein
MQGFSVMLKTAQISYRAVPQFAQLLLSSQGFTALAFLLSGSHALWFCPTPCRSPFMSYSQATAPIANPSPQSAPLFPMGQIVATPAVADHFAAHGVSPLEYLVRHVRGDWGDVPPEDAAANQASIERGTRILSSYKVASETIWVITEADRSSTTLLFPSEY